LGELKDECETLSSFLSSKLKADLTSRGNKIYVDSNSSSSSELKRLVNKVVYRRHLNHKYSVALEGDIVKVNKFKRFKKKELPLQRLSMAGSKGKNKTFNLQGQIN